ncbi:MAG: tandem-95 repeat protein, partial [Pseudomonadota bacterium]
IDGTGVGTPVTGSNGGTFTVQPDGTVAFAPGDDFNGLGVGETATTEIVYQIDDGEGGTDTAVVTYTVTGVNDAPIPVDPSQPPIDPNNPPANTPFDPDTPFNPPLDPQNNIPAQSGEDSTPTTDLDLTPYFGDPDAPDAVTLSIPAGELPSGVTFDPTTGVISGTPDADASQGGDDPTNAPGVYTIPVTATDPHGATFTTNVTYTITNPPPVAENDALTGDEDTVTTNDLTPGGLSGQPGQDQDPDGDTILVTRVAPGNVEADLGALIDGTGVGTPVTGSNGGTFTVQPDGTVTFTPSIDFQDLDAGEMRTTEIVYQIDDGEGGTDTAVVTYTVTGVNDAPVVIDPGNPRNDPNDPSYQPNDPVPPADPNNIIPDQSGDDAAPLTPLDVSRFFTDVDGEPLTFGFNPADPNTPAWLTIDPTTGVITGTPPSDASQGGPNNNGVYPITIVVMDPDGAFVTTTVDYTIANPPPIAIDDLATVDEDSVLTASVLPDNGNGPDTDPDGDTLEVSLINGVPFTPGTPITLPSGALLTMNSDGSYSYDPNGQFEHLGTGNTAPDNFTYQITDNEGGVSTATVSLTVIGVNDPPRAEDDDFTTPEDTPLTFDPRENDSDVEGDDLTVTEIDGQPITPGGPGVPVDGGVVRQNPDGSLTFTPTPDFNGTPVFSYTIADPEGLTSTASISITVTPTPDVFHSADPSDPPKQDTPEPPLDDLSLEPIVVNTVEALGGFGERTPLGLSGASLTRIVDVDHIRQRIENIENRFGLGSEPFSTSGLSGYSLRNDIDGISARPGAQAGAQLVLDTLMRDGRLSIEVSNTMGEILDRAKTTYTVTQFDGSPLPDWLEIGDNGMLLGEVPPDRPQLDLRIVVTLANGSFVENTVRIQTVNGEIQQLRENTGIEQTGGFSKQLNAAERAEQARIEAIDRVLRVMPSPHN